MLSEIQDGGEAWVFARGAMVKPNGVHKLTGEVPACENFGAECGVIAAADEVVGNQEAGRVFGDARVGRPLRGR